MACEFCGIISGEFEGETIYEDDNVHAVMHLKPAAQGHILLFPKQHYAILEQVPDDTIAHLFTTANKLSTAIFESIGVQGTNILIRNGTAAGQEIAHVTVHIIPRTDDDNLKLEWQPIKADEEATDIAQYQIKEQLEKPTTQHIEQQKEQVAPPKKNDYRIKQLRRIP
jgi:histidine triad (HIT) family protein